MKKEYVLKTISIYLTWSVLWIIFLFILHHFIGLDYNVWNGMNVSLLLAIILLLKDIIFDFILEKTGTLEGWKSWYPWFEHLPLAFFLILIPFFIDGIDFTTCMIAFIDFIVDGYQDIQYRKK